MDDSNKKKVDPRGWLIAFAVGLIVYFVFESIFKSNPDFLPLLTQIWGHESNRPVNYLAFILALVSGGFAGYLYEKFTGISVDNWGGPPRN